MSGKPQLFETIKMSTAELWALDRCELLYGVKGEPPAPKTLKEIEPLLAEAFRAGEKFAKSGKSELPNDLIPERLMCDEFMAAWEEWASYRASKRKKLTPQTAQKQLKFMAEIGVERAIAAIDHSIRQGYQGLFEPNGPKPKSQFQGIEAFEGVEL